ncbi:MAG: DUF5640 domain-containing protein [Myxococcota bacterium]
MANLAGTWKVQAGPFAGLVYDFRPDGTFEMEMAAHGVHARGTYTIDDGNIDIHFVENSAGEAGIGVCKGICELSDSDLNMKVGPVNGPRWTDASAYVSYKRV